MQRDGLRGYRKVLVALATLALGFLVVVLAFFLALRGKLTPEFVQVAGGFSLVAGAAVSLFSAANAMKHWADSSRAQEPRASGHLTQGDPLDTLGEP